jgi:uroporphyrinogen III methyltransferase/synthase
VLARTGGTLVVLMGWAALQNILETLAKEGMPGSTPVALIQWGTWTQQRTVIGCLEDIGLRSQQAGLKPPVVAVIGPVVALRERIRWFDRGDSPGKRVLITRSRTQASKLRELLELAGAQPLELPSIENAPLEDYRELDRELDQGAELESRWVIFGSTNAVDAVFARLSAQQRDARVFANATIGAIGPATAQALAQQGIRADFVPASSTSEAVVEELSDKDWTGVPVLLPGADIGREVLAEGLAKLGAQVRRVTAYRTVTPSGASDRARQLLEEGMDVVTFTSSSTVSNLMELLGGDKELLASSLIACIGPVTAKTATELGIRVDLVAKKATVEGLVEALVSHWEGS